MNDEIEFYKSTKPGKHDVSMTIDQFVNNAVATDEYGVTVVKYIENSYKREVKIIDRIKKYAKLTTDPENINAYLRVVNEAFKKCDEIIKSCEKTNKSTNDQKSEEKSVKESVDNVSSRIGFDY